MKRRGRSERNDELRKILGSRIKEFRTAKGFTQAQLAELVDVTEKHLSQIEQGISFPSIAVLMDLCTTLQQPVEAVLYGAGEANFQSWRYIESSYTALSEDSRITLQRIANELLDLENRLKSKL